LVDFGPQLDVDGFEVSVWISGILVPAVLEKVALKVMPAGARAGDLITVAFASSSTSDQEQWRVLLLARSEQSCAVTAVRDAFALRSVPQIDRQRLLLPDGIRVSGTFR